MQVFKQLLWIHSQSFQLLRQNYAAKIEMSCTGRILGDPGAVAVFLQESSLQVRLSSGFLDQETYNKTGMVFLQGTASSHLIVSDGDREAK